MAAAKGGFTAISAMANTFPVADTAGVVEQVFRLGQEAGFCDVFPIGAVTQGLAGKSLAELGAMANSKAKVRIFSDDGKCVSDPLLMRRALEYVKTFNGIIAQHAQEPALTIDSQMNEGIVSSKLGLAGWPAVAEEAIIARDILLAEHVGSRLHICHLTTAGGVDLVRFAKSRGINVTAEVTPHHLLLTDDLVMNYDSVYKVNPPLRTEKDVLALRKGLADGTIDIVGTDHAPHPTEDKDCEWQSAAFGMVGLETALSVVVKAMIETKLMSWGDLVDRMSIAPAKIAGYSRHGQILKVGAAANLTIIDTTANWIVDRNRLASKSKNTPFEGMKLPSQVLHTFLNGNQVLNNGEIVNGGAIE
jgi:dihydroorotase